MFQALSRTFINSPTPTIIRPLGPINDRERLAASSSLSGRGNALQLPFGSLAHFCLEHRSGAPIHRYSGKGADGQKMLGRMSKILLHLHCALRDGQISVPSGRI